MMWDPNPVAFSIPWIDLPILWYGIFFALGFWLGALLLSRFLTKKVVDRLSFYIIIATVAGARLAHLLFYEHPSKYLSDPLEFFRLRNGGLASHGAVLAVFFALFLFSKKIRREEPSLTPLRLLDLLSVVAPLTAACIRIGNFVNQEILGKATHLPWAITFRHPIDGSAPIPRHPVQLYEAFGYVALFSLMWYLSKKPRFQVEGLRTGLLFTLLFALRFVLEFYKEEQSSFFASNFLTMGQILSLPFIAAGMVLIYTQNDSRIGI